MRRLGQVILMLALTGALVMSLGTAHAASCGGPWTGPMGTNCTFTSTSTVLTFGGFAVGPSAAIGIAVYSPPGVFAGGCSNSGSGFATCNGSVAIPSGQTVICVVKGLNGGAYACNA